MIALITVPIGSLGSVSPKQGMSSRILGNFCRARFHRTLAVLSSPQVNRSRSSVRGVPSVRESEGLTLNVPDLGEERRELLVLFHLEAETHFRVQAS